MTVAIGGLRILLLSVQNPATQMRSELSRDPAGGCPGHRWQSQGQQWLTQTSPFPGGFSSQFLYNVLVSKLSTC